MTDARRVLDPRLPFDKVVMLRIEGRWHAVDTAAQALACLRDDFAGPGGPSFRRALETCDAVFTGLVPPDSLRAAFVVAAMEAGYPFEVLEKEEALERRVAAEAENALMDAFISPEE